MTAWLPMFPLGTVLFPGVTVPLHVFEDRYRALVHRLLRVEDPAERLFGSVAIREGYEVGDHGAQSLHRVGTRLQLTEVEAHPDGTFDVVAVGRDRIRLDSLDTGGPCPVGEVTLLDEDDVAVPEALLAEVRAVFTGYAARVSEVHGQDPHPGSLPRDPAYLAWTLSAVAPLPMPEQQALLAASGPETRLRLLVGLFRRELAAMNVVPSLPATRLARTGWSPN